MAITILSYFDEVFNYMVTDKRILVVDIFILLVVFPIGYDSDFKIVVPYLVQIHERMYDDGEKGGSRLEIFMVGSKVGIILVSKLGNI